MIKCSLGEIERFQRVRSLSGYTFAEVALPLESYSSAPTFTLTSDHEETYRIVASEVFPTKDSTPIFKATAILEDQAQFLKMLPVSFDDTEASKALSQLGIKNGPEARVTLVSLALTQGELAILLANAGAHPAFVDFEARAVLYYSELYKEKARQVPVKFKQVTSRVPYMGGYVYGEGNEGYVPDLVQAMMPFGEASPIIRQALENYNQLCGLFSTYQVFPWDDDRLPLGTAILSTLTKSKCIVCAVDETWTQSGHTAIYYAI